MKNPDFNVGDVASRLGVTRRRLSVSLWLMDNAKLGMSLATAAILMDVSENYLKRWSREWGIVWRDYQPYAGWEEKGKARPTPRLVQFEYESEKQDA